MRFGNVIVHRCMGVRWCEAAPHNITEFMAIFSHSPAQMLNALQTSAYQHMLGSLIGGVWNGIAKSPHGCRVIHSHMACLKIRRDREQHLMTEKNSFPLIDGHKMWINRIHDSGRHTNGSVSKWGTEVVSHHGGKHNQSTILGFRCFNPTPPKKKHTLATPAY